MADMDNKQQPGNPRARLQQLLAVPERDRTDEQWDEINELEIMLASGNRRVEAAHAGRGTPLASQPPRQGKPNQGGPGGQGQDPRKQGRKFHKRPKRKGP
ncbi:MAG TPA: hypothetical protein VED01_00865 [Burkholderiales bacterium]|nr:hypothetical protein [Burkholderiales bacterium]